MAIPQSLNNKKIDDIIRQITKPGSILKETECVAVVHDFFKAISENLKEGYGFVSEYIRIQPTISGVFNGNDDQFDPLRHQKQISASAGTAFKNAAEQLKLEKVQGSITAPIIKSVYDLKSQETNTQLSPGHMIEVQGSRLKINRDLNDEGIFLVKDADGNETKVEQVHTNLPSRLSGMLPEALSTGNYTLEIRNRQNGNNNLSIGVYSAELSVN